MPKVDVFNIKGEKVGETELSDEIFNIEINEVAVHTVVKNQLANKRQGTQSTRTRAEVSGGGKKPWRQKGTGRARQGSTRSPQWVKGGIAFGPKPRDYSYTVPKKIKRLALKSALTSKQQNSEIIVLDEMAFDSIKTADFANIMKNLNISGSALFVLADASFNIERSARNIPKVKTAYVNTINTYDIVRHGKFVITKDALTKVEEVYAQ